MAKLKLLCLSDLHLGEDYVFLDYPSRWNWNNQEPIESLYWSVARLAGLNMNDLPQVQVETLVLSGDILELATATIKRAAESSQNLFEWLLQWLHPDKVVYITGNHDHVFWMWWNVPPEPGKGNWWTIDPVDVRNRLKLVYGGLNRKATAPQSPVGVAQHQWRKDLVRDFFGLLIDPHTFYVAYPTYEGPPCSIAGLNNRVFKTLFTHGHMNDGDFVDPDNSGMRAWFMYLATGNWPRPADKTNLNTMEESTWKYTTYYWYPPMIETPLKELLYLAYVRLEENHPCVHPEVHPGFFVEEIAPELHQNPVKSQYLHDLAGVSGMNAVDGVDNVYVYGHTHDGGAISLDHHFRIYNTGGWLDIVTDDPPHTHVFAIDDQDVAKMVRV